MRKKKGFPFDSYFKMPNVFLGDKDHPGWIQVIDAKALAVYCLIAKQYNHQTGSGVYTSHKTMASMIEISRTTLGDRLKLLLELGLIERAQCGKRRRYMWTYKPKIPVPAPGGRNRPGADPKKCENRPDNGPKDRMKRPDIGLISQAHRPGSGLRVQENRPISEKNRPIPFLKSSEECNDKKENATIFQSHTRLYTRLYKSMSPEEQVTFILQKLDQIELKTQVQVAWNYWCHIWEQHYGRPYYLAKTKSNSQVIPKDKKNLKDKIAAVGFGEVIARMERCMEICDHVYPCEQKGKWIQPIILNDFISNHFFDKWIVPKGDRKASKPKSSEDRLRAAIEKRRERPVSETEDVE